MRAITLFALVLIAGCASEPYNPAHGGTERTVTVNWSRISQGEALAHAEKHCQQYGRHAQFAGKEDFWLYYNCVQ